MKTTSTLLYGILVIIHAGTTSIYGQSAFTYQGRLQSSASNTTGLYDLQFGLFNSQSGGTQIGPAITRNAVPTSNGLFTVSLDFGAGMFDGSPRWLQIGVKTNAAASFTPLAPRQPITPTPEAMFAQNVAAGSITGTQLAGDAVTGAKIANGQVVRSINFLSDAVGIVPGEGLALNTVGNTLQLSLVPQNCFAFSNCYWSLLGNGNITPGVNFLGTVAGETAPLELRVNNTHATRYELSSSTPNIIGGYGGNSVAAGKAGVTIGGGGLIGQANTIAADFATINGGRGHAIGPSGVNSTIGGGSQNIIGDPQYSVSSDGCTIGGGVMNLMILGEYNTIGGGFSNQTRVSALGPVQFSTIGGGRGNEISGGNSHGTIGGGTRNRLGTGGISGTIGGGEGNVIGGEFGWSTIGGGWTNEIQHADAAAILGGQGNRIGAFSVGASIGGGEGNNVPIDARHATIPGGRNNEAVRAAFAAGTRAKAVHQGAYVWGDSTDADIASTNENSVTIRASGGYRLFSNPTATIGTYLAPNSGSWISMSDRKMKDNFEAVNPREVLAKVTALPVQRWNYKTQDPAVRHIGPTAQDFKAAFNVGETDTGISTVDADGVALAAIQGLNQKLEEQLKAKDAEIGELRDALKAIEKRLVELNSERSSK